MKTINWDNSFETGIQSLDHRNRNYIDKLNGLIRAIQANPLQIKELLGDFLPYARRHFGAEEFYLARTVDAAAFADHRRRHRFFQEFLSQPLLDDSFGAEEVCGFLADWTEFHIRHLDKDALSGLSVHRGLVGSGV